MLEKSHIFKPEILMYMYEEKFEGRKLTEVVNERHENVKYLPGFKFTDNVVGSLMFPTALSGLWKYTKNPQVK